MGFPIQPYESLFCTGTLRKKEGLKRLLRGAFLKNGAILEGGAIFSLSIIFRKEITPHFKEALFSKTAHLKNRLFYPKWNSSSCKKKKKLLLKLLPFLLRGTIIVPLRHCFQAFFCKTVAFCKVAQFQCHLGTVPNYLIMGKGTR